MPTLETLLNVLTGADIDMLDFEFLIERTIFPLDHCFLEGTMVKLIDMLK